ncbi:MAG: four helix bundle protein [Bacteroidetes bacterium]|nr:four helix bundle protein [Bacteroidota bacterium]
MRNDKDNLIVNLTFQFSLEIISYCEQLESIKKFNLSNQLFRSGTSIGANVREAQNAESKADFIHKMKIAAKEAEETEYWLLLCQESKSYPTPKELISTIASIHKILTKIISSTKRQSSNPLIK